MTNPPLPRVVQWTLFTPLYEVVFPASLANAIWELLSWGGAADAYCPECEKPATYRFLASEGEADSIRHTIAFEGLDGAFERAFSKTATCTRCGADITALFRYSDKAFVKVGQHPAIAELLKGDAQDVLEGLGLRQAREYSRAVGLASHGIGIGSFVYLRRILESIVEEAHQDASDDPGWDEVLYKNARMRERVSLLEAYLPELLVSTPQLYSHLSQGLHELTEDECKSLFPLFQAAIHVFAAERVEDRKRKARMSAVSKAIALLPKGDLE